MKENEIIQSATHTTTKTGTGTHFSSNCDIQPGGSGRESGFEGFPYPDMILA
jgi:hypothetical protein